MPGDDIDFWVRGRAIPYFLYLTLNLTGLLKGLIWFITTFLVILVNIAISNNNIVRTKLIAEIWDWADIAKNKSKLVENLCFY